MPTSPTRKPAGDDGRQPGHEPTMADRIKAKLRQHAGRPVDANGWPIQPPPPPPPSTAAELAAARAELAAARAALENIQNGDAS